MERATKTVSERYRIISFPDNEIRYGANIISDKKIKAERFCKYRNG